MRVYITPEHYEQAAAIGVSRRTLYQRVYLYGWDVDRAVSTPVRPRTLDLSEHWLAAAAANGISRRKYARRVATGWGEEEAATMSHADANRRGADLRSRVSAADIERAATMGLSAAGLRERLRRGWTLEVALTTPKIPLGARSSFGRRVHT